jgi:hypothetical protein
MDKFNTYIIMKKLYSFFAVVFVVVLLSSCKTASHTNCDAYGSVDGVDFDIYSSHNSSMQKFVSTSAIK